MNRGLKNYTKQLTQTVGNAGMVSVNINEADANMHMVLPLLKTIGLAPIDLSIIYDHMSKEEKGLFGKGFRLNFNSNLINEDTDVIKIKNADGSVDTYSNGELNKETQLTASWVKDDCGGLQDFTIKDKQGNVTEYTACCLEYPSKIETKAETYIFDFIIPDPTIQNGHGDLVTFVTENNKVKSIVYSRNNAAILIAKLNYDSSDRLVKIIYTDGTGYTSDAFVRGITTIVYESNQITLKDDISLHRAVFNFDSEGRVTSFTDGYDDVFTNGRTTSIEYNGQRTMVNNFRNEKTYFLFDNNGMLRYAMDNDFNVVETEFDATTKQLLSQSNPIPTKVGKMDNLLHGEKVSDFTIESVLVEPVTCNDSVFQDILQNSVCKVTGTGENYQKLSKRIYVSGLATDSILAILWGKKLKSGEISVTLSDGENNNTSSFGDIVGEYDLLTLGISPQKSYDYIDLTIFVEGTSSIEIGGVQIIKKNFGSFYKYDANGNLQQFGNLGTAEISYGVNNLPTHSIGVDSTLIDFEYDKKDNLEKATTAYGVKIENTYDLNNNLTKTVLTNMEGKKLVTEKTYDADGRFVKELKDELGNTTKYTFDNLGNLKQVTDALGVISQLSYTNNGLLRELILKKGTESANAKYTYNSRNLLQSVVLSNGSKYEFFYSQQNLLTKVTLNGYTVFEFTYDEKSGNIDTQSYGGGDKYKFIYNDKGQIQQVMYVSAGASEGTKKFEYTYNESGQLTCVKDENGNILSNYSYDNDGRINRVYNSEFDISQEYDTLGNVNMLSSKVKNKRIYQSFDSVQRSKGSHPGSLSQLSVIDGFIGTFEKDGNIEKKGTYYLKPIDKVSLQRDGMIPCVRVSPNNMLRYALPFYSEAPLDCGCIMFWFKLNPTSISPQLFYCKSSSDRYEIGARLIDNKVILNVTDYYGKDEDILISTDDIHEGWNFLAVNFMNRHDGEGYPDVSEFSLTVNANTQFKRYKNPRKDLDLGANPVYYIGCAPNNYYNIDGYVAAICITQRDYLTFDQIQRYYRASKDYVIDNQFVDKNVNAVDFGQTTMYTINSTIQDRWEIFPLHSGVTSLKGIKPVSFDLRRVSRSDKNGTFHFNNKIKRYAYVADGAGTLCYNIGQGEDGTIMMRAFTDSTTHKQQYLFDGKDINGKTLGLYRDKNLKLCIDYNGSIVETGLKFTTNEWHEVGLSFASEVVSNYDTGTLPNKRLRLFLDGQVFERLLSNVAYTDLKFYIGQRSSGESANTNLGLYLEYYPLHGQIEMLAMNCAYNELDTLQTLASELTSVTKVTEFDELGMLSKIDIHKAGETILSNEYKYKTRSDNKYLSQQISSESIRYAGNVSVRNYETDALGRVTKITDGTFGNHSYKYNYRGFLEEADGERYAYDGNGNITQLGTTVFAYDSYIKDKLISVGGLTISYSSKSSLNPTGWKNKMYKYEGKRLIRYTTGSGYHEYTYNDQGQRIEKKKYTGETTKYYYAGDKLITEINSAYRLDFLYDENGQLYGVIRDNASKFFYVKDCLNNILGIVNEDGTLVAKYNYTGFGESQTTFSSDKISWQNPFRFKGYYLDSESGMYYCHTRYYVPEWGRWLNADHPGFLEFDNLSNVNLFSYCGNNPVMNVDPTGTFVLSLLVAAVVSGLVTGMIIGGIYGGVTAAANGQDIGKGILIGALSGMLFGGIAGFAGYFMGPLLVGAPLIGSLSAVESFAIGTAAALVGGFTVGLCTDIAIQSVNNNGKIDYKAAVLSGLQAGFFTLISAMFSSTGTGLSEGFCVGIGSGIITSSFSMLIDVIKNYINKKRSPSIKLKVSYGI